MNGRPNPVVLMVDDDEDDRLVAQDAFEDSGAPGRFIPLGDEKKLLDYLSRNPQPAVILLDIKLPLTEEFQILKEIKANPSYRNIPVVILSTYRSAGREAESLELGADAYFTKPPTFPEWVDIMDAISDRWLSSAVSAYPPELE